MGKDNPCTLPALSLTQKRTPTQAFREARRRKGFTVRRAAQAWGISPGRVSQVEADDANLYAQTIAEAARRMGYRAQLRLIPLDGGEAIEAELRPQQP